MSRVLYFLSQISKNYANNSLNLLSSQKIELRNLKLHNLPNIFNMLHNVGLNTEFEAGHTVRRVLTCPVNGIDETQLFDVAKFLKKFNSNLEQLVQLNLSTQEQKTNDRP